MGEVSGAAVRGPAVPPVTATSRAAGWRGVCLTGFGLAAALVLWHFACLPPVRYGDGFEYYYQLESLARHASPDLRPADVTAIQRRFRDGGTEAAPDHCFGYYPSRDGRSFSYHFWLYALSAVPAKLALRAFGANELAALPVTNAALLLVALFHVLFTSRTPLPGRLVLAGLALTSPVLWYVRWTGPEVFSWSMVLLGLSLGGDRRYALAAAVAGLAATQNPPIVCLAGCFVLLAVARGTWSQAIAAAAGAAVSFVPPLFYLYHYGTPSVIVREGFTSFAAVSAERTLGILFDLNQGILPYQPLLIPLAVAAAVVLVRRKDLSAVLLAAALAGMMVLAEVQVNWNAGCLGLMRYAVWMLPVFVWLVAEAFAHSPRAAAAVGLACVSHGLIAYEMHPTMFDYLQNTPVARLAYRYAPWVYNPEPEIFIERCCHAETWAMPKPLLPVGFARGDGRVTKLLADAETFPRLRDLFVTDPNYRAEIARVVNSHPGPVYIHPPAGKVWLRR